ncbi:MAG: hypothetical protein AB7O97_21460 [Planctomycetota bacterium]
MRALSLALSLGVVLVLGLACSGGGGGGDERAPVGPGPGGGDPPLPRDWGPIPPGPRLPGDVASATFAPAIEVQNPGAARTATVLASVPFPWGRVQDPNEWSIDGAATAWRVLQRWPDDTVRIAQAQWVMALPAASQQVLPVVQTANPRTLPFAPHPVFAADLPGFEGEVTDPFGTIYRAAFAGPGETLHATELVRVRRHRGYHQAVTPGGIGRDYLSSTFYVTEFAAENQVLVDWILGNDYLGADDPQGSADPNLHPLGGVDIGRAAFRSRGADVVLPYRPVTQGIEAVAAEPDGHLSCTVMRDTYLSDGQTRRYRFLLLRDDPALLPPQRGAARAAALQAMTEPLRPLATHDSWRQTHALGLLGGPGAPPTDAVLRATLDFTDWVTASHFGTFGSQGDPQTTGQTGTPRNGPLSPELAHAVQSRDPRLLEMLEQKAWTQALRPYHLYGLRVERGDDILLWDGIPLFPGSRDLSRESLGRRALLANDPYAAWRVRARGGPRAHGFQHFDEEHFSMDLLFDHWSISGDAWALEELRQLGESLRGLLRPAGYITATVQTARAEGWCMQGLVQAFVATGDLRFRDHALDRLHDIVEPGRRKDHKSRAMRIEGSEVRTGFPSPHEYYMPWQHGGVLYGYLAAWKFFGDPLFLAVCDDVARCVSYGWVENVQHPVFGFVPNGVRYYVPTSFQGLPVPADAFDATVGVQFGDAPLGGPNSLLTGGMLLLSTCSTDPEAQELARRHGELLLDLPLDDGDRWDKWFSVLPPVWD